MLGSPQQEAEILEQVLSFRNDPVGFVLWSYPWGQPGTPLADIKGPRDWQLEELERIGEHVRKQEFCLANDLPLQIWRSAYSSGRGPGKSALLGMTAHWQVSCHLGSTVIVSGRDSSSDSRFWLSASFDATSVCESLRCLRRLVRLAPICFGVLMGCICRYR